MSSRFRDLYTFTPHELGKGGYGVVKLAVMNETGCKVAVKMPLQAPPDDNIIAIYRNEANICSKLKHQNIVTFFGCFEEPQSIYLVSEFMAGGELFDYINANGKLSEDVALSCMCVLLDAIAYCHRKNIMHRDIKPDNLLLTGGPHCQIKLADFGYATEFKPNYMVVSPPVGTVPYMAPEILTGQPYTQAVDVWSSGVLLYILLVGYHPFLYGHELLMQNIVEGHVTYDPQSWSFIRPEAKSLVQRMLTKNVQQRITVEEALNDPWILQLSFQPSLAPNLSVIQKFKEFNEIRHIWGQLYKKQRTVDKFISLLNDMRGNGPSVSLGGQMGKKKRKKKDWIV